MKKEADLRDRIEAICLEFPRYGYRRVTRQLQHEVTWTDPWGQDIPGHLRLLYLPMSLPSAKTWPSIELSNLLFVASLGSRSTVLSTA